MITHENVLHFLLVGLAILLGRVFQDVFFLGKIDAFNRENKVYMAIINFVEALYGISIIKLTIDLMRSNFFYAVLFGMGSTIGGFVVLILKKKFNNTLEGQRKYFVRIAVPANTSDLVAQMRDAGFKFAWTEQQYVNGINRIVIEITLKNRKELEGLKAILRSYKDMFVTILHAEDVLSQATVV
ncbi:hypothetical protein U27_06703 [Candidatus Vecturithrix granuli]|uniref:DUF5698 domain-containing protein n=1 Tax=Vecturithrix granuli TaxID=1499967 RepID=A0A081C563_VECG1|nr:hypothetical protein U27_06703 [Candidatus Vecturithrix granuli]